jgi:hypothetical protein
LSHFVDLSRTGFRAVYSGSCEQELCRNVHWHFLDDVIFRTSLVHRFADIRPVDFGRRCSRITGGPSLSPIAAICELNPKPITSGDFECRKPRRPASVRAWAALAKPHAAAAKNDPARVDCGFFRYIGPPYERDPGIRILQHVADGKYSWTASSSPVMQGQHVPAENRTSNPSAILSSFSILRLWSSRRLALATYGQSFEHGEPSCLCTTTPV